MSVTPLASVRSSVRAVDEKQEGGLGVKVKDAGKELPAQQVMTTGQTSTSAQMANSGPSIKPIDQPADYPVPLARARRPRVFCSNREIMSLEVACKKDLGTRPIFQPSSARPTSFFARYFQSQEVLNNQVPQVMPAFPKGEQVTGGNRDKRGRDALPETPRFKRRRTECETGYEHACSLNIFTGLNFHKKK